MKINKTFKRSLLALSAIIALAACQQNSGSNTASTPTASGVAALPADLQNENQQISYALGFEMSQQITEFKKHGIELDKKLLTDAIIDQLEGKESRLTQAQRETALNAMMTKLQSSAEKKAQEALAAGEKFLNENKTKEGVQTTKSGLQYKVVKEGTGNPAKLNDGVLVEYVGTLIDGTEFDKSPAGEPAGFPVKEGALIPGFIEGLQLMKEGGEYTLYIPSALAYGPASPTPAIPPHSTLIFNIKIQKIERGVAK